MTQYQPPPHPYPPQQAAPDPPKKKTPLAVKIIVIAALLIWVGGCGAIIAAIGGADPAATTEQPAPSATEAPTTAAPTPVVARSYATVVALRNAVVAAGYPCPKWERWKLKTSGLKYANEAGTCSEIDWLSTYADADAVAKQADEDADVALIVGPNWILFIPEDYREPVATALGGKVIEAEPEPEPEPEPEMPGIGDKVTDDSYQFVVTKFRCGVSRVGSTYANEKAQGQFCLVSLRVKNVGDDPISFSSENQALMDTKGKEYSPDDEAWIYIDDAEIYTEINPGNSLKTTVPFDVPKKAKPDHLLLKAGVFGFSEGVRVKL